MDDHKKTPVIETTLMRQDRQLHPMVAMAMGPGASLSPEMIGQMMQLQRDWEAGEAKKAYQTAMVRVKSQLPAVIKKDTAGKNNRFASMAAICTEATPILTAEGFNVSYPTRQEGDEVYVTCRITHGVHNEDFTLHAPQETITNREGKPVRPVCQDIASVVTFLRRYTLTCALGFGTADMKDIDKQPADPATIDTQATLRVMGGMAMKGRTREQCEAYVGRPLPQWTLADLDTLRAWAKEPAPAPEIEPDGGEPPC
uniref:Putative Erf family protein n=1 Tax=viral metagenome TaxID=1070528 RepID=A0A6H1Z8W3_9ZZZZ